VAEWPEPEADPEEPRRWMSRLAIAGAVGAGLVLLTNGGDQFRLPNLSLPEFELPSFDMPEVSLPDLRGRESSDRNAAPASREAMNIVTGETSDGAPITRPASIEVCTSTVNTAAQTLGPPSWVEDGAERRVSLFKLIDGQLIITCVDGTMRIEQTR